MRADTVLPAQFRRWTATAGAIVLALVLTACTTVARVAVTPVFVNLTRIMSDKVGATVIRQSGRLQVTRLAGDLAEAALAAYLAQDGRQQEGWTLVVTRRQDGAARSEVFEIAANTKLYARTDGQTLQTFDPGKRLITIEARTTDSTVAVLDSPEEPVRTKAPLKTTFFPGSTDVDLDTGKTSGKDEGSDLHAGWGLSPRNGTEVAKTKGRPTLGDCAVVKPGAWTDHISTTEDGDYCLITSEGRFGALHIDANGPDYTIWQTATGTS
ncbi:hypothetical protein ACFWWM_23180 [Streptomyces sp. NPDC058682]|uniref:hypothetical protein n=1 Tax=Streptomyces sp. NPDC058682 TaxID=3346596 RepID=UPI00365A2216